VDRQAPAPPGRAGQRRQRPHRWPHLIVGTAAVSAAGVGALPIPFSDWALLLPIQVGMLAGITSTQPGAGVDAGAPLGRGHCPEQSPRQTSARAWLRVGTGVLSHGKRRPEGLAVPAAWPDNPDAVLQYSVEWEPPPGDHVSGLLPGQFVQTRQSPRPSAAHAPETSVRSWPPLCTPDSRDVAVAAVGHRRRLLATRWQKLRRRPSDHLVRRPCAGSAGASLRVLAGAQRRAHAGLVGAVAGVVSSAPVWPSAASDRASREGEPVTEEGATTPRR
jgi:hypothetical protein